MGQEQFVAVIPYISADLIAKISQKENISENEALNQLYSSRLYEILEREETKVWQYSTEMLYALFTEEKNTGNIMFPDV